MIEYLILLWLVQYRSAFGIEPARRDSLDDCLKPGAGLDYQPPERKRPELRLVK